MCFQINNNITKVHVLYYAFQGQMNLNIVSAWTLLLMFYDNMKLMLITVVHIVKSEAMIRI
jgi:hypothetical protein